MTGSKTKVRDTNDETGMKRKRSERQTRVHTDGDFPKEYEVSQINSQWLRMGHLNDKRNKSLMG